MAKKKIKEILFVCTGNSCRSIMAEGLLKKILKELGHKGVHARSAGIAAADGLKPAENTIAVMKREGIDVSDYQASLITEDMVKSSDLILTMSRRQKEVVLEIMPQAREKTHLLKEYVAEKGDETLGLEVEDPIGLPLEAYERVLNMLKESIGKLVRNL